MNARPPTRPSRPQTDLLGSSTSDWYAAWKARKAEVQTPPPEPKPPEEDAPEALARWLAGDTSK